MKRNAMFDQLDLRLLKVFIAVFRERHIGRAADTLGMTQPAVSTVLARLRKTTGDPLFIRSAEGMQATEMARKWYLPVAEAMKALEAALSLPATFDPATSRRTFIIYMTDVGQLLVLNRLMQRVAFYAPRIHIRVVAHWEGSLADRLHDGSIDMAFGWIPQLKSRKSSILLFKDRYVGLHDTSAPVNANSEFLQYAVADIPSSAHHAVLDRLQAQTRVPVITTPSFFILPEILVGKSYIAVVPERFAKLIIDQRKKPLSILKLPFMLPTLSIRLHWSASSWHDGGIDWLRQQITACLADPPALTDDH
ncbi:hypothetical protein CSQ90_13530 [Janthinobacterium sp. BJB303]|nr:hypothetical protein CSQ90_13530 [Janthinobacterium sp. BJB303]